MDEGSMTQEEIDRARHVGLAVDLWLDGTPSQAAVPAHVLTAPPPPPEDLVVRELGRHAALFVAEGRGDAGLVHLLQGDVEFLNALPYRHPEYDIPVFVFSRPAGGPELWFAVEPRHPADDGLILVRHEGDQALTHTEVAMCEGRIQRTLRSLLHANVFLRGVAREYSGAGPRTMDRHYYYPTHAAARTTLIYRVPEG